MDSNTPQLPPFHAQSRSMDSIPPSETESRRSMGGSSSTTPQLPPNFNNMQQPEPQSRPSTPPQLIPPNFNINFQLERHPWTSLSRILREDGTIQLPPNFNLKDVESMQRPPLGLKFELTPEILADYRNGKREREEAAKAKAVELQPPNKASTIRATSITIGPNWRKESIREDHLTLKLYFKKKKLIWEFLEGPLKEKIEVSWSDITAIHAHMPRDRPGLLKIQLGNKPLFFREITPLPGKHTRWEKADDFTVMATDALYHRIHAAEFGHGVLNEHYTNLLQTDQRLLQLSRKYCNPFPYPNYPSLQGGESSTAAPCLPSSTSTFTVNTSSTPSSIPSSHSHLNPIPIPFTVGVGERSFHMQGESSRYANHHQTPLLMPSQQLPFSFNTGVEQTLPFNYPTPSIPASDQYLNPAMTTVVSSRRIGERSFHMQGESSSSRIKADHHNSSHDEARLFSDSTLLAIYSQPLAEEREYCDFMTEFNQFQNINHSHHINGHQPSTMESIAAHDDNQNNNNNSAARAALGSNNNIYGGEQWPELDGDGNNNTGNDSMDLYSIIRSTNINRRPPT